MVFTHGSEADGELGIGFLSTSAISQAPNRDILQCLRVTIVFARLCSLPHIRLPRFVPDDTIPFTPQNLVDAPLPFLLPHRAPKRLHALDFAPELRLDLLPLC